MRPMLVLMVVRSKLRPKNTACSLAEKRQRRAEKCMAIEDVHGGTAKGQRDIPSRYKVGVWSGSHTGNTMSGP